MFTSIGARHFLGKFQSFGLCYVNNCLRYRKLIFSNWHSFRGSKGTRGVRRINQQKNKSSKLAKKVSFEPEVYLRDTISKIYNILRYSTWDSAQEQLESLPIKWDSFTVNKVLKTHPPMEKSWLFFNWASNLRGFKHDQFTYTTMLDIFGEARRISSMKYVFQQMQAKGIKIDAVTYTSLMHWLSNDGDIEGAINLWQEMIAKGCSPTIVSYTAYMKILFNHKRVEEGIQVYKEMLDVGFSPNCFTYTVLMDYLATSGGMLLQIISFFSFLFNNFLFLV